MTKVKIVILTDWYLPGTKAGGPVRSIYSLCELLKDEFEIHILTSDTDLGCTAPYKEIDSDKIFEKDGIHYSYLSKGRLRQEIILKEIQSIQPDLIYLNSFWSYPFSIGMIRLASKRMLRIPLLLAPRGMLSEGAMSLKSWKKNLFLLGAKLSGWYRNIPFHATNEQEKTDILRQFPNNKVFVAPNVNSGSPVRKQRPKKPGQIRLFYLSRIARVKNLHFALETLKQVPSDISVTYDIFGNAEDTDYKHECDKIISELPSHIKVNYKGELPFHQVQPAIAEYHALFLPTLNENFGHSIVESLLCGCAVLISDKTPWNEVNRHDIGAALPLTDQKAFIDALIRIAKTDQAQFDHISAKAIDYISAKIDRTQIIRSYKDIFHAAIENRSV